MPYTVTRTTHQPPGTLFYKDYSEQGAIDSEFIVNFRKQSPGYVSELQNLTPSTAESPSTAELIVIFESKEAYDAYWNAVRLTPEYIRRDEYLDIIGYDVEEVDVSGHSATPT